VAVGSNGLSVSVPNMVWGWRVGVACMDLAAAG